MTTAMDALPEQLNRDFDHACEELTKALLRQRKKDTPGHRGAVLECRNAIDWILDAYLDFMPACQPTPLLCPITR
jgi:hypothetical protein